MKLHKVLFLVYISMATLQAQSSKIQGESYRISESAEVSNPVLFTIQGESIKLNDFLKIYERNNTNNKEGYTQKMLEDYMELYINFKLKVKEAEALGMDTFSHISNELQVYRQQLAKTYLFDKEVNEQLITEAYERMKKEVNASHILISLNEDALPADTLEAFKKAILVRRRLLKGEDFEKLAKQFSGDPSAQTNGGNIGYFTVFQTVYPFENVAYSLKPNEISMPVRTKFGYHIVKVNDVRPALGKMSAAHILIKLPQSPDSTQIKAAKIKADDIYKKLIQKEATFQDMVVQYSEDRQTNKKGGLLPEFGIGTMVQEFETAAFALQNNLDISKPIKTDFGFHIIQRINRESIAPLEEIKPELKKRVERDSRSSIAKTKMLNKIKSEYNFQENLKAKNELFAIVSNNILNDKFDLPENNNSFQKTLFQYADKQYTQSDFLNFIHQRQRKKRTEPAQKVFDDYYNLFVETSGFEYEESQLDRKYPDFKQLMQEYKEGILLFELTDKKVWSLAITDTVGLAKFYQTIKNKYMWPERAEIIEYEVSDDILNKVKNEIKKGKLSPGAIAAKYNGKGQNKVTFEYLILEKDDEKFPANLSWSKGSLSPDLKKDNGQISFSVLNSIQAPTPKKLEEAKGFIISDYQEYLEKEWVKELRKKYTVNITPGVLEKTASRP